MLKRTSIVLNIISISIAILIVYLRYSTIKEKFFPNISRGKYHYTDNTIYTNYVSAYSLYTEQKNVIMLGSSLTNYANWNELLNRSDIANRGIGGDITSGLLGRIEYILDIKPKIVFIEGGVNDIRRNISEKDIIDNLTLLIDTLNNNNIIPVLSTVTLLSKQYNSQNPIKLNKKIKQLNEKILKLAQDKKINIIDLNQFVSNEYFCNTEFLVADGIHFTAKTYSIWKREVEKILNQENL